jgi:mRNA interferase RelE/StbE
VPAFRVVFSPAAAATVKGLPPDVKRAVREALVAIAADPYLGKELLRELRGLRSHRARRYRVIYSFTSSLREVRVVAIGHRETVYEELTRERLAVHEPHTIEYEVTPSSQAKTSVAKKQRPRRP